MRLVRLDEQGFEAFVRSGPALAGFWAEWSLPSRSLEPLHENLREPLHEIVTHRRIAFAFCAQALAIETDHSHLIESAHVKRPAIGREKP